MLLVAKIRHPTWRPTHSSRAVIGSRVSPGTRRDRALAQGFVVIRNGIFKLQSLPRSFRPTALLLLFVRLGPPTRLIMSGRRGNSNRIRGPQSALTDFLAANNISAAQIRDDYLRRRAAAAQDDAVNNRAQVQAQAQPDDDESAAAASTSSKKRKRRTDEKSKAVATKSKTKKTNRITSDDAESDFELPSMYKKACPLPGQLENCDICDKRFTVTPYSKTGPDGGLLCTPCGKELKADEKAEKKTKRAAGKKRRKTESDRLDGLVMQGPKSLQQLCIEKVADHHLDIDEFGDLPEIVLDRLSEIFSKRRVLNPRTLGFFLRPDLDKVAIHDGANLNEDDYKQVFAIVPNVQTLILRNASQFKDNAMLYMIEKAKNITHFQVYGANLITDKVWHTFLENYSHHLETLKLEWLDAAFDDSHVNMLVAYCPNVRRLKLKFCRRITSESLLALAELHKLEHLSLQFSQPVEPDQLVPLIAACGGNLRTLSLENCPSADDTIVNAIRLHCAKLTKLRLTDNYCITDAALASLFAFSLDPSPALQDGETWKNPPLTFIDLSSTRDMDNTNPTGPSEVPIGLASKSFQALMSHSGSQLRNLNIASCRHISHAAFCDVFNSDVTYPALEQINVSFCNAVDGAIINGIFSCCPNLIKLIAFGCFKIDDVVVPKGVALIGVPKAQDAIEQYGDAIMEMNGTLSTMVEVGA